MKKIFLIVSIVLINTVAFAQGIEFKNESYAATLKQAKKEKKAIFIDVYTSWCGPCKFMSDNVFTLEAVGKKYNENFICIKLDAEKSEDGKMVAKKFSVSAYPTLLFVDGDGDLVYRFLGGRDEKGIIKEADLAIAAFEALPELKKLEKKYRKGERSKEFLNNFYIARNRSGLDCGEVLVDYFNLLSDEEIAEAVNVERIGDISKYDAMLSDRLITLNEKVGSGAVAMDKKLSSTFNKGVGKLLGAIIVDAAKNDREADFESIMDLRARYIAMKGNGVSVTSASLGGGNVLMPTETMRLDYYGAKSKNDKYVATFERFIAKLQTESIEKKAQGKVLAESIEKEMESAKAAGDSEKARTLKQTKGFMAFFALTDDYYISTTLISSIDKYIEMYKGEKNSDFQKKIVEWYLFLSDMHVSCKSASYAAEKLLEMGKREEAIMVLTEALAKGKDTMGVEAADVQKCTDLLTTLATK